MEDCGGYNRDDSICSFRVWNEQTAKRTLLVLLNLCWVNYFRITSDMQEDIKRLEGYTFSKSGGAYSHLWRYKIEQFSGAFQCREKARAEQ